MSCHPTLAALADGLAQHTGLSLTTDEAPAPGGSEATATVVGPRTAQRTPLTPDRRGKKHEPLSAPQSDPVLPQHQERDIGLADRVDQGAAVTSIELPGVDAYDWRGRRIMVFVLPEPQSVGSVRHTVKAVLGFWKLTRLSEIAELLTSELVTNAIQHAGDEQWIKVTVWHDQQSLSIDVRDRSTTVPRSRRATTDRENGRGLLLVEHLSDSWACRIHPDGTKTVSCRLNL